MRAAACGLALLLVAAGLLRAEGAWLAAAVPFAAFAALGLVLGAPAPRLAVSRSLSTPFVPSGAEVDVQLTLRNLGPRLALLAVIDGLPEGLEVVAGGPSWRGTLEAGSTQVLRYSLRAARGDHAFGPVAAVAEDPFTAVRTHLALPCASRLVVHPRLLAVQGVAFGPGAARPFAGGSRTRRTGTGAEFAGTRDYAPGDPLRCLNWRAEALWGRPVVNVFEEARAIDVGLILDCRCEAYEDADLFESAVAAALALGEDLLDRGNRVAFLSYGSLIRWTPPGAGRLQRLRLRMAAARAELGAHAAFDRFDNLPVRIFPPRSLVLVVSPLRREDVLPLRSLRALGYEVALLRPDPLPRAATTEGLPQRILALERDVLLSRLFQAGLAVLDWNPGRPLAGWIRP